MDSVSRELLDEIWDYHDTEFSYLMYKLRVLEPSTHEENDRMVRLFGEQESLRILRQAESARFQHKQMMKKCRSLVEYNECLKSEFLSEVEASVLDVTLDNYVQNIRKKTPTTAKENTQDILRYSQYRKEKLYKYIENLPDDLDMVDRIEKAKLSFNDSWQKYSYLHPIVKDICPRAFEPHNYELQAPIMQDREETELYKKKLAKILNGLYHDGQKWHNFMDNKRRIVYKSVKIRNNKTGRTKKLRIADLTDL